MAVHLDDIHTETGAMQPTAEPRDFVPAAGKHWALPFYDLLAKVMGADRARRRLADEASDATGGRFLEIGCGTGSLLLLLKRAHPAARVHGLDPDPAALAITRRKAGRANLAIETVEGFADALPFDDGSIDRVFSSLMYHHLRGEQKGAMLREVARVLVLGGRFHMMDFGGPGETDRRGFIARHIHSHGALRQNDSARVLARMAEAGLTDPRLTATLHMHAGDVCLYQAGAPAR